MIKRLRTFLGRYGLNILIFAAAVLASVSTVAFFSSKFVVRVFGDIPLHQVLFNLSPQGAGNMVGAIVHEYGRIILNYSAKIIGIFFLIWGIATLAIRRIPFKTILVMFWRGLKWVAAFCTFRTCTLIVLIAASIFFVRDVDHKFHLKKFLEQKDSPFVEENYAALNVGSIEHTGGRKRNLIVIMLESMESGFANASVYGENLIPELQALTHEGLELKGYHRTQGGWFTIDGMSAQLLGMPLMQLPTDIHDLQKNMLFGGLLSRTSGIFNVLKTDGYETASFLGTSKEFAHMGCFLQDHGIDEIFFAEDWMRLGFPLNDAVRGRWDYSDDFLFSRFEEWLAKPKDRPFAVCQA